MDLSKLLATLQALNIDAMQPRFNVPAHGFSEADWTVDTFAVQTLDDRFVITGRVTARTYSFSSHGTHHATIGVAKDAMSVRTPITANCSCGRAPCAHGYRLLMEAKIQADPSFVPTDIVAWASRLSTLPPSTHPRGEDPTNGPHDARDPRLGAIIQVSPHDRRPKGTIQTFLLEIQPGGRRPKRLKAEDPGVMEGVRDDVLGQLTQLTANPLRYHDHRDPEMYDVSRPRQEAILVDLLRDGMVWADKFVGAPLTLGPTVTPLPQWVTDEDGSQSLRLLLPNGCLIDRKDLLRLRSHWYIHGLTIGRLEGDGTFWTTLLAAPRVSAFKVEATMQYMNSKRLPGEIPRPQNYDAVEVIEERPTPVLRVRLEETAPVPGDVVARIPVAYLTFDYAGWEVTPEAFRSSGIAQCQEGKRIAHIHRDIEAHIRASTILAEVGLAQTDNPSRLGLDLNDLGHPFLLYGKNRRDEPESRDMAEFLQAVDACAAAGFHVLLDGDDLDFEDVADPTTYATVAVADPDASSSWFDLELGLELDGQRFSLGPVITAALGDSKFPMERGSNEPADARWTVKLDDGQIIRLPLERLRRLIAPVTEWMDADTRLHAGRVRLGKLQAALAAEELGASAPMALKVIREGIAKMREIAEAPLAATPAAFQGELRPYQREGLRWLDGLAAAGFGGVLADDMGLGKTAQLIAHILSQRDKGALKLPVLVVAPTSVVGNWRNELEKFAPSLRVLVIHGAGRVANFESMADYDIVITSYPLLPRDIAHHAKIHYGLVVLDESQAVKNVKVLASRAIRKLHCDRAIPTTGTPLENRTLELWNQTDIAMPGLFGDHRQFTRRFATPIEKHGDLDRKAMLQKRLKPFVLRRTKAQVATDLPPKTVSTLTIELEGEQRALYESLRAAQLAKVQAAIATRGLGQSGIIILEALLKLRQACCHPKLVKLAAAQKIQESAKLAALLDMLREAADEGRRVLVFSCFSSMLEIIGAELDKEGLGYVTLTGATKDRQGVVAEFQQGNVPIFLITLKAGGVGLNLTAADTVIHFDPWWNPAAEDQATDRAHRIGQNKPIFVYRLICQGTVEEKIEALKQRKANLAADLLEGSSTSLASLTESDVAALFSE